MRKLLVLVLVLALFMVPNSLGEVVWYAESVINPTYDRDIFVGFGAGEDNAGQTFIANYTAQHVRIEAQIRGEVGSPGNINGSLSNGYLDSISSDNSTSRDDVAVGDKFNITILDGNVVGGSTYWAEWLCSNGCDNSNYYQLEELNADYYPGGDAYADGVLHGGGSRDVALTVFYGNDSLFLGDSFSVEGVDGRSGLNLPEFNVSVGGKAYCTANTTFVLNASQDMSGWNNTLEVYGADIVDTPMGQGLKFNGSAQTYGKSSSVGTSSSLYFPDNFTISFWANVISSGLHTVYFQQYGGGVGAWVQIRDTNRFRFYRRDVNGKAYTSEYVGAGVYALNEWNHFVASFDIVTGTTSFYKNGVLLGTDYSNTTQTEALYGSMYVGAYVPVPTDNFNGTLDEVFFYDRTLNPDEVTALANKEQVFNGTVAYYPFDELPYTELDSFVYDFSGSGMTLNNQGATRVAGAHATGMSFDGSTNRLNRARDDVFDTDLMSISAWINPISDGTRRMIFSTLKSNGAAGYQLALESNNKFRLWIGNAGLNNVYSNDAISYGSWIHVVATYDGARIRIFQDNVIVGNTTATGNIVAPDRDAEVGDWTASAGAEFNGSIDEVMVFNRNLSIAEISALYTDFVPSNNTGLLAYWSFDESNVTNISINKHAYYNDSRWDYTADTALEPSLSLNSCNFTDGNTWNVSGLNNCNIGTNLYTNLQNVSIYEGGKFSTYVNVTGWSKVTISNGTRVTCKEGGCFK